MIVAYFIIAFLCGGLCLLQTNRKRVVQLAAVFMIAQGVFFLYTLYSHNNTDFYFFTYDSFGLLFFGLLSVLAPLSLYHSVHYLNDETVEQFRIYNAALVFLSATITGAYFSNNITVSWILIEATTIAAALLVYHRRTNRSLEATWKYIFVCSTGIALAYLGILFLSLMLKGQHELNMSYESLANAVQYANPLHLKIAFVFILVGYSCKMELFPLYTIGIDANHAAPSPASAFISTCLVNLGFVSIFRIYSLMAFSDVFPWAQNVMLLVGILSLIVSAVYLQRMKHFKRMLAYSTVENMGIVALCLGIGGAGYYAAIFHVLIHSLVKSTAFFQIAQAGKIYNTYQIENTGDYFKINPLGALVIIGSLIGLLAIPPSALFVSEFILLQSFIASGKWVYFILTVLIICFVAFALGQRLLLLCYKPFPNLKSLNLAEIRNPQSIIQLILLAIVFGCCFFQPQWLINTIQDIISVFPS